MDLTSSGVSEVEVERFEKEEGLETFLRANGQADFHDLKHPQQILHLSFL